MAVNPAAMYAVSASSPEGGWRKSRNVGAVWLSQIEKHHEGERQEQREKQRVEPDGRSSE